MRSTIPRGDIVKALTAAGFAPRGELAHSVKFRHTSGEPAPLVFDPAFDPMIDRAERVDTHGDGGPVVRTADLIAMKERAAADPARCKSKPLRDRADIELLWGHVPDPDEGW